MFSLALPLLFTLMGNDFTVVQDFKVPKNDDAALAFPYAFDSDDAGRLFVIDAKFSNVHIWNPDGSYEKSFSQQGEGPGELFFPVNISIAEGNVFVWDSKLRMVQFDADGNYITQTPINAIRPQQFVAINEDAFLLGYNAYKSPTDIFVNFSLINGVGKTVKELKSFRNNMFLAPLEGQNMASIKAFGPAPDVQRGPDGLVWFGFSQNNIIYSIQPDGSELTEHKLHVPAQKPNEEEMKLVKGLELPTITGQVIKMSELPGLNISFDHEKSFYTHFLVLKDKFLLVSTPLGGTEGVGNGFNQASWYLVDRATGKAVKTGRYALPEGSIVLYRNGRIIAFIEGDMGDFTVQEIKLPGM